MEKIYCSREPWDSILDKNRPNGTSRTWNMMESGELKYPLTMTEDMVLTYFNDKSTYHYQHFTLWNDKDNFEDIEIKDIDDKHHIYPIRVHNHKYFQDNLNTGFECISPKVLGDVRDRKALIVIECTGEGKYFNNPGTEFNVIERWRVKSKLPEFSVVVVTGNLMADKIAKDNNHKIKIIPANGFLDFFPLSDEFLKQDKIIDFKPLDSQKYFLSFNRAPRPHRVYLGYKLWINKLLSKGKVSLNLPSLNFNFKDEFPATHFDYRKYRKFHPQCPITIDAPLNKNLAYSHNTELYENTFISIVTETLTDLNCIFFSEKIWKPISLGHPFLLIGNPHSLKKLKELGFKTFDKWFDESYDNEFKLVNKIDKVVNILETIVKKTDEELIEIREEMKEILTHNKNLYLKYRIDECHHSGLAAPGASEVAKVFKEFTNK